MRGRYALYWLTTLLMCAARAQAGPTPLMVDTPREAPVRRIAVIVGANHAIQGQAPLKYGQSDADKMAGVLTRVGHFDAADIHVLKDPSPAQVLAQLDGSLAELQKQRGSGAETLLFFYYSGHADAHALYPGGLALPLTQLRSRLNHLGAAVRIGLIDACQSGVWTQSKGFTADARPFEIASPLEQQSEGSVYIASSSGLEAAHESDLLGGSFFTHYFASGLLGAADSSQDGNVTLQEAFDYAKILTIRDSTQYAPITQHPSFAIHLRGRSDLVLTQVGRSSSVITLEQKSGPLELIHLSSGLKLAELAPGKRRVQLAMPPGRYLIRRSDRAGNWVKEILVEPGRHDEISEQMLTRVASPFWAVKGIGFDVAPRPTLTTLNKKSLELRVAFGLSHGGVLNAPGFMYHLPTTTSGRNFLLRLSLAYGINERLQWLAPLVIAYRFGEQGHIEVVPWGGISSVALSYNEQPVPSWRFAFDAALGTDFVFGLQNLPHAQRVILSAALFHNGQVQLPNQAGPSSRYAGNLPLSLTLGYGLTARNIVTLHFSMGVSQNFIADNRSVRPSWSSQDYALSFTLGSGQFIAMRPLPLIQVHALKWLSIDGYVGVTYATAQKAFIEHYLLGATVNY